MREAWAFATAKFLTDPVWFLMLFWLPKYFASTYHVDLEGRAAADDHHVPLSDVRQHRGGWMSSKLIQRGQYVPNFSRKVTLMLSPASACCRCCSFRGWKICGWRCC